MEKRVRNSKIVEKLNNISLKRKLMIIQVFCVILPLFVTDTIIVGLIVKNEKQYSIQQMNNIADSAKFTVGSSIESASLLIQKIYMNQMTDRFSNYEFENELDYYNKYNEFIKNISTSSDKYIVTLYMDNPGIINGGYCKQLDTIMNEPWYEELVNSEDNIISYCDYSKVYWEVKRQISIIRKLNYYGKRKNKDVLKVDMNYSELQRQLINAKYSTVVYVCDGDRIILSNEGKGGLYDPFEIISDEQKKQAGVHNTFSVYGNVWDIYVMPEKAHTFEAIKANRTLLAVLLIINLFLPFGLMRLINKSFTQRIQILDAALENDKLAQLPEVTGTDEISMLMLSYNRMAERMNNMIQNEYMYKLKKQESDIARQKAELLALHSQINPHFLFNALESIRMHSVLKNELETATMVEKLALMQRQNVEWGNDAVYLKEEIKFVEAYLELQRYRFGNRLRYEIDIDEACNDFMIPKLSVVTYVENACVHGMENKTSASWVFVRASKDDKKVTLEIEDTGNGMDEKDCEQMMQDMNNVEIGMLKEGRRVGMLNAALRLKMYYGEKVRFEVESEKGTGTLVTISIPLQE